MLSYGPMNKHSTLSRTAVAPSFTHYLVSLLLAVACVSAGCTGSIIGAGAAGGNSDDDGGDDDGGDDDDGPGPNPTPPPDPGEWSAHVIVRLTRMTPGAATLSFGLPLPAGVVVTDAAKLRIAVAGGDVVEGAQVREILGEHDANGARTGVKAVQIQLPASVMTGDTLDIDVTWTGGAAGGDTFATFGDAAVSTPSPATVRTAVRSIESVGGAATLVESSTETRTLYVGREPHVLATYPDGYLAQTRVLGHLVPLSKVEGDASMAGLAFLPKAVRDFSRSAMYDEPYAINPAADSILDPITNYEGWLYDRCSTWLIAYSVTSDVEFLREGMRACSYYASQIDADGFFLGKPSRDEKYSHLRGLYAYYALTGDEEALRAGKAIADLWHDDILFVGPYADGHTRGPDKLWTERLLGTSMEGLYYGSRLTGDTKYLTRFQAMLDTSYRHLTGDAGTLALINPGIQVQFPPQNCFVHSGEQQADAGPTDPWCSMWMSELAVDVLLRWQEQSGDERVDEMFVRLTRAMRDFATSYFHSDMLGDSFLEPTECAGPERYLVPLYGAGITEAGERQNYGDYSDYEHCADASAVSAAGVRGLFRQGGMGGAGVGPFATEGASFLGLHQELAACAEMAFTYYDRSRRDPAVWTAAQLAPGLGDPATFIAQNKIGYPRFHTAPQRKFSWWFNMSLLQFGLLADAGIELPTLTRGAVQPASCP